MKFALAMLTCAALLFTCAACGTSGADPPFALSCTVRKLPSGFTQARVKITNGTAAAGQAVMYGPTLDRVRHISPAQLYAPAHVTVTVSHTTRTFIGFVVPGVQGGGSRSLTLRLEPPLTVGSILVTQARSITASDWGVLDNPDCRLRRS